MEINILKLNQIDSSLRLDSDFYKREYIKNDGEIQKKGFFFLGDKEATSLITDGDHGNPVYAEEGIPYIKAKDISDFDINLDDIQNIEKKQAETINKRCFTKKDEVIISTVGTIGVTYIIKDKGEGFILSRDIAKIKTNKKQIIPEFLYIFLKTRSGKLQVERYSTGSVQKGLYLGAIKQIKIPKVDVKKQEEMIGYVKRISELISKSKNYFSKADELIIKYLSLEDIKLSNELFKIKKVSELDKDFRLDSEYYQTKYETLKKRLSNFQSYPLEKIAIVTDGDHGSPEYLERGILFLRALNVRRYFLDYKEVKYVAEDYHKNFLKRSILKGDDIIVTKIGTIGVTAIIPNIEANTTASCGKIRIRKEYVNEINPYYVSCFLNNLPGKLLMQMDTTGSVQTGIILKTLRNLVIPVIDYKKQLEIQNNIKEGIKNKEGAEKLIKEAISQVENWISN